MFVKSNIYYSFSPKANKSMHECLIFNSEQSSHKDAKKWKREKCMSLHSSTAALLPVSTVKIFTDMSSACVHNFKGLK